MLLTTNRSSRVFAKYALLLPPRLSHLQQRLNEDVKADSPPCDKEVDDDGVGKGVKRV